MFQDSQGYMERHCLKNKTKTNNSKKVKQSSAVSITSFILLSDLIKQNRSSLGTQELHSQWEDGSRTAFQTARLTLHLAFLNLGQR